MKEKRNTPYTDVKTVESWRNEYIAEEFPEGPYGAATNEDVLGKETPFLASTHASPQFTYEAREFHQGDARPAPNAHPTHDEGAPAFDFANPEGAPDAHPIHDERQDAEVSENQYDD